MDYIVIVEGDKFKFEKEVKKKIEEGYMFVGNLVVIVKVNNNDYREYCREMFKPDEIEIDEEDWNVETDNDIIK